MALGFREMTTSLSGCGGIMAEGTIPIGQGGGGEPNCGLLRAKILARKSKHK